MKAKRTSSSQTRGERPNVPFEHIVKKKDPLEYLSLAMYGPPDGRLAPQLFDMVASRVWPLVTVQQPGVWDEGSVSFNPRNPSGEAPAVELRESAVAAVASVPGDGRGDLDCILGVCRNPRRKYDAFLDYWMTGWWSPSKSGRTAGLCFCVRTSRLQHHVLPANNSEPAITKALHETLDYLIEVWEPHYALLDVSDWQHAGAGDAYWVNPVVVPWSHVQQQAETAVWNAEEDRQHDHVRGIYWGQLLNPRHLAKLGGIDAVRRDLEKMGKWYYLTPKAKGYAFLQLGPGPMNSSVFGVRIPYFDAAVWYRRRIVETGLLM